MVRNGDEIGRKPKARGVVVPHLATRSIARPAVNAFRTDPQLKQIRADLGERAEKTTFSDGRGGILSCPDPQLQTALRGVTRAIEQLPMLEAPRIAAVEGSEATIRGLP